MPSKKTTKKAKKKSVKKLKKSSQKPKKEQVKLLENLVEEMAGVGAGRIVEILYNKKDVNEFLIAKKMELTINQVRNILYKLSAEGLVSFIRKKDKRKGWYIYYWTLDTEKCLIKLEQSLLKKIAMLESQLQNRHAKRYYNCESCEIEVSEETALDHNFSCEECAEVYQLAESEKIIKDLKRKISRLQNHLESIQEEIKDIQEKKATIRKRKATIRKKEEKREKEKKKAKQKKARKEKAEAKKAEKEKAEAKKSKKKSSKKSKKKTTKKKSSKKSKKKK